MSQTESTMSQTEGSENVSSAKAEQLASRNLCKNANKKAKLQEFF